MAAIEKSNHTQSASYMQVTRVIGYRLTVSGSLKLRSCTAGHRSDVFFPRRPQSQRACERDSSPLLRRPTAPDFAGRGRGRDHGLNVLDTMPFGSESLTCRYDVKTECQSELWLAPDRTAHSPFRHPIVAQISASLPSSSPIARYSLCITTD